MSLISDGELRLQLQKFGVDVGPITSSTRSLYQKKLRSLRAAVHRAPPAVPPSGHARGASVTCTAGVKRRRHQFDETIPGGNESKKPKLALSVNHTPTPSRSMPPPLYPDLSDMLLTPHTSQEAPTSSTPIKNTSFIDGGTGSPVLLSRNVDSRPPSTPPRHIPPQRKNMDELFTSFSPAQDSEDESLSLMVSPPSPQSLSSSSPPKSPPKAEKNTSFFKTVTKFLGSQVSQLFGKAEPRRRLSSSFSSFGARRRNAASTPKRGAKRQSHRPVISPPGDDKGDEMVERMLLNVSAPGPSSSSPSSPSSKYDWELEPTEVTLCKKPDGSLWRLGKGGFGEVFKGLRDGVDEVAIKIIKLHSCSPKTILQFKAEIDLISKLRHRNIVQFYGACVRPQNLYMVTELMSSDLFSVLRLPHEAERYKWTGIYGREVLVGVAVGLNYLHSRRPPVVHRDIKSPNILVMDGLAKIADVGVARTMASSDMTAQGGFSMAWAAPEVVYRRRATEKIDIWSYGIVVWEVVSGRLPGLGKLVLPQETTPTLKSLYSRCISDDPAHRPTSLEIVNEFKNIH